MTHREVAEEIYRKLAEAGHVYDSQFSADVVTRMITDILDLSLGRFKQSAPPPAQSGKESER